MKILHVATYAFPDAFGGAERYIHDLAREQAALGHDVTILTGNIADRPAEERHAGVRFIRYPLAPLRGLRFALDVHGRVNEALRALAPGSFDILHAHQVASALPALGASFPARRVMTFHASHRLEFEAERLDGAPADSQRSLGLGDRMKSMAVGILDRRCLRRAERIIVLTEFVRGQVDALVLARVPAADHPRRGGSGSDSIPGTPRSVAVNLPTDERLIVYVRFVRTNGNALAVEFVDPDAPTSVPVTLDAATRATDLRVSVGPAWHRERDEGAALGARAFHHVTREPGVARRQGELAGDASTDGFWQRTDRYEILGRAE